MELSSPFTLHKTLLPTSIVITNWDWTAQQRSSTLACSALCRVALLLPQTRDAAQGGTVPRRSGDGDNNDGIEWYLRYDILARTTTELN